MQLGARGTGLTAGKPQLIFAYTNDFLYLGSDAMEPPHVGRRQRQTVGRKVLGAVSDGQHFEDACQPPTLCPIGVMPMGSQGMAIESAVLLEAAHEIPAIVPDPLQQALNS